MPRFAHGPVEIDYLDEGEGEPVVLVHGFASTKEINWVFPGWVTTLRRAGRRAVCQVRGGEGAGEAAGAEQDDVVSPLALHGAPCLATPLCPGSRACSS